MIEGEGGERSGSVVEREGGQRERRGRGQGGEREGGEREIEGGSDG